MVHKNYYIFLLLIMILSCSSKKNILYLQDSNENLSYDYTFEDYKIKVDDILKIDLITMINLESIIPEAKLLNNSTNKDITSRESMIFNGYQVNTSGNIIYPQLGEIKVAGKSINELRLLLSNLVENKLDIINPDIDIKILNLHYTILGEVSKPGRCEYIKNNLNLLEAIGIAGDLTINGERKEVKIIRSQNNQKNIISVDLTKSEILISEFQIFSGDIIIVNPNTTRVKNAGIIGNSGTLLSLLSFLLSSIIVINNT